MAKRQRSVSLSFVLMRFAIVMLGFMLLCCLTWYVVMVWFQNTGIIYQGAVSNRQVEKMMAGEQENFVSPGEDFLAGYALFDRDGRILESNVEGKKLEALREYLQEDIQDIHVARRSYQDGSTAVFKWHYRAEFVSPMLRQMLPPAEYLMLGALGASLVFCLVLNTLWLRRHLAAKLRLFGEVSEKVAAQKLDFVVPHAGIREYDQALGAMEHMREALYSALSSQWAAQQEREAEIAALAHDLKTPLTLVGGNAELLLDEELPESCRRMVETIAASNDRAKQYMAGLLEASAGEEEAFEDTSLASVFEELCRSTRAIAEARGVFLHASNSLEGAAGLQKNHVLRALGNVVQNAIEHTPAGGNVYLAGSMADGRWQVEVRDEGPGFSREALQHAAERLWRGDPARGAGAHNGLGLWSAAQAAKNHSGELKLCNCNSGGMVTIKFGHVSGIKNISNISL